VGEIDAPRVSWTVSVRARDGREVDRSFEALVETCRAAIAEAFPSGAGYDAATYSLSGPIEGARFVVTRGRFRGHVSAQRFVRSYATQATGPGPVEVRLIASVEVVPAKEPRRRAPRALAWAVLACVLGTLGLGTLVFAVAGLFGPWTPGLMLLPAFVAWRTAAAIARTGVRAPGALTSGRSAEPRTDPVLRDAMKRWRRIVPTLAAQREAIDQGVRLPPFRAQPRAIDATG